MADVTRSAAVIRQARPEDVPILVELNAALFDLDARTHDAVANLHWPMQFGVERFAGWLEDANRTLLVAETDDGVIDYLSGRVESSEYRSEPVAVIGSLLVREGSRRGGVGADLVTRFSDLMRAAGVRVLEVTAYAANTDARRFYGRAGFTNNTVTLQRTL
jgi:GNAT superfamily N-acetyltransferase